MSYVRRRPPERRSVHERLPIGVVVGEGVVGERYLQLAVCPHREYLVVALTQGLERYPPAVRRPGGETFGRGVSREPRLSRAVRVHRVDVVVALAVARKRYLRAVGRPVGCAVVDGVVGEVPE